MRRWIGCGKYYQAYIAETDDGQRGLNNRIVKLEQALNGKASNGAEVRRGEAARQPKHRGLSIRPGAANAIMAWSLIHFR